MTDDPPPPRASPSAPRALSFSKYEGLGNDFLIVFDAVAMDPAWAAALCDRHLGVGGDGVLLVGRDRARQRVRMDVWNADGSRSEMCGNGLRCVALALAERGDVDPGVPFEVETDAGPHRVLVVTQADGEPLREVTVDMRAPSLDPADLPFAGNRPLVQGELVGGPSGLSWTAVSMGNPHLVTFDAVAPGARARIGPELERYPAFPQGVNVGFAELRAPGELALTVWERGVGITRACGTGACAAAVAAVETGRHPRETPITVRLPGGPLTITVGPVGSPVRMTGPARHVFDGRTGDAAGGPRPPASRAG